MNYYERHLGDYAKDTAHLTMIEHGAYGLLLDRYYGTEQGIPADQAHRIARARSKEEKQAVDDVLAEFFSLVEGVWTNSRAEEEIAKVAAKIPVNEAKKENEKERQRRSRERRKSICDALREYGIVPPWNSTITQLQTALDTAENASGHAPVTRDRSQSHAPVTPSDTANQAPSTKHQAPDLKNVDAKAAAVHLPPNAAACPPADPISGRAIDLASILISRGAALQASDPRVRRWAEEGISDAQALTALDTAQQRREDQANPQPVNAGLIDAILGDLKAPNSRASPRVVASSREGRISNYAAEAAAARGEHGAEHSIGRVERDITGEAERVA